MYGLIIALAASVAANSPAAQLPKELEPLAFLVGHCWRGEFVNRRHVDVHCFESVYGKHIRDRHEVTGGKEIYRGETVYTWNPELKKVEYTYWNSVGGVSRGTLTAADGELDFGDEVHVGPDGKKLVISTKWRRAGPDAYETVSSRNDVTGDRIVKYTRVK